MRESECETKSADVESSELLRLMGIGGNFKNTYKASGHPERWSGTARAREVKNGE